MIYKYLKVTRKSRVVFVLCVFVCQELALLKDIERTASITCREECELMVVHKEVFAKVCPRIFDRELEEKVAFLRSGSHAHF